MSAITRKLGLLPCTYSMLLRLCVRRNHQVRLMDPLSERKFGTFARLRVHFIRRGWKEPRGTRSCSVPTVHHDPYPDAEVQAEKLSEFVAENMYAHNLLINSLKYQKSMMKPITTYAHVTNEEVMQLLNQDWTLFTSKEILSAVKRLSYNVQYSKIVIKSHMYKNAMDALCSKYIELNDEELMTMIRHLTVLRQPLTGQVFFQNLCVKLDKRCIECFMSVPINNMLVISDTIYRLFFNKDSEYIWYVVRKLGNKPGKLSAYQLVQLLFFLNVCRKPCINMYELEYQLEQCLDELSINEIGVAALGFFKTRTRIRSTNFLDRIMTKTVADIEQVDNISIGGIAKLIRYSLQPPQINMFITLLNALKQHETRFTLMTLTHFAHACAKIAFYDKEFMDRLAKRLSDEVKTSRLKNLERLIFVFATFNLDFNNSVYCNVIEELRATWNTSRAREIARYPYVASRTLGFLSYVNIYPTDLIQRIMTPEFIHKICNGNFYFLSREYCVLDYSLQVEVPEYNGPFLKSHIRDFLTKKHFLESKSTDWSRMNLLITSVLYTCQEVFNNKSDITLDRLLPHYPLPDIILRLDEQNQLLESKKFLDEFTTEEIKCVNEKNSNVRWIALVLAPLNLLIRDSNLPIGILAAKIRQLSKIGYTPIMISQVNWNNYTLPEQRCDYIKNLIFKNNASKESNT